MRYMFGVKDAYKAFTLDKLIGSLIKQVQTAIADSKSQELFDLLRREREIAGPTTQDLINHRKTAEKILGPDENLFRLDWLPELRTVTIQLLGKDDNSFDDSEVLTGRWQAYIDSYVSPGETVGVPTSSLTRRPFLKRTKIALKDGSAPSVSSQGSLAMRVCVRTYRIFYVSNTEESLWRVSSVEEHALARANLESLKARQSKFLETYGAREEPERKVEVHPPTEPEPATSPPPPPPPSDTKVDS